MRLLISKTGGPEWLSWLKKCNGNIYHSVEWADSRLTDHSRPIFFHWLDKNDSCVGVAVGIESWSPRPLIGRLSKRLDFESYPAATGDDLELTKEMIKGIVQFAEQGGFRRLSIQSFSANRMVPDLQQLGFTTTARIEFILDLGLPETELWKRLSSHHRRKINKAEKYGLQFEEASTIEAMQALRKLLRSSRDRRVDRGEEIGLFSDNYYEELGKSYFDRQLGRVFLISQQSEIVSGAFVSLYAGKAYYVLGGSSPEGFEMDAPALLFWKIFSRCRELECREFNMGGVPASANLPESPSYGLYRFKAGFGGRQVNCLSGSAEHLHSGGGLLIKMARNFLQPQLFLGRF